MKKPQDRVGRLITDGVVLLPMPDFLPIVWSGVPERIAAHELSPDQAQANITYLRSMLAQQNAWQQLRD